MQSVLGHVIILRLVITGVNSNILERQECYILNWMFSTCTSIIILLWDVYFLLITTISG